MLFIYFTLYKMYIQTRSRPLHILYLLRNFAFSVSTLTTATLLLFIALICRLLLSFMTNYCQIDRL